MDTNLEMLKDLYHRNRSLPHGGARLSILGPNEWRDYWTISDGVCHLGSFGSASEARTALKKAGFVSHAMASERTVWWHTY